MPEYDLDKSYQPFPIEKSSTVQSHIFYHLILRQCSLEDYPNRIKQHTDLGSHIVAAFSEQADSETKSLHFHCIVRLPQSKKTFEDKFRKTYDDRNLQVIKQIKPPTLDPTHLENTLMYVSKDGHKVADDGTINWDNYMRKRQAPKVKTEKPTFNMRLVEDFTKELAEHPELYHNSKNSDFYNPSFIEGNTLRFIRRYFTGAYKDFDETILIRKYHFLNSMFGLGGIDVVDMALSKLLK